MTPDRFAAVVPARDEAATITDCIESILRSATAAGMGHDRFEVVIVADSCNDDTAGLARRALGGRGVVIEACAGSAGQARAIGTSHALARWATRRSPVWTVHTDADSIVPEGWLHRQRRVAEIGFAAVAGVVEIASLAEHSARTARRYHRFYAGPGDDHPHVHGANLGVRATPTGPSAAGRPSPAVRTTRCGTPYASLGIRRCRRARSTSSPAGDGSGAHLTVSPPICVPSVRPCDAHRGR